MSLSITSVNPNTLQQYSYFVDNHLPMDILRRICFFLEDPQEVAYFGLANKRLTALNSDPELWSAFLHKDFLFIYVKFNFNKFKSRTWVPALYKNLAKNRFPCIYRLICSFLDNPKDIVHYGLTNRHCSVILSDNKIWTLCLRNHFPESYFKLKSTPGTGTWWKNHASLVYKALATHERKKIIGSATQDRGESGPE
jgi:hypothetical protein